MENKLPPSTKHVLTTHCGKEYPSTFKTMKLVRDEKHTFHVVYKTFTDEYIYTSCNPFQDSKITGTYHLITESEAKAIFLERLSADNVIDLFDTVEASVIPLY